MGRSKDSFVFVMDKASAGPIQILVGVSEDGIVEVEMMRPYVRGDHGAAQSTVGGRRIGK